MSSQVEYLVIGAGSIGRRHFDNLTALGAGVELIAWRQTDRAVLERKIEQMRPALKGLIIATQTQIRLELVEICARHDLPFYVEKPVAFRREDLDRIYETAGALGSRCVVGFMMRYHPAVRDLHAIDRSDAYGFAMEIGHDVTQWRQNWKFSQSYAAKAVGGGVLLDLCHELDMAHCLFPGAALQSVDCIGHAGFPGVDVATRVAMNQPGGPLGTVSMDYLSPLSLRRIALRGRDRVHDVDLLAMQRKSFENGRAERRDYAFERNQMFLDLMADFMALACGQETSANPLLPRMDHVYDSCAMIADAWEMRRFHGTIKGGIT